MADTSDIPEKKGKAAPAQPAPEDFSIEELAVRNKVPTWAMSGLKEAYNWGTGKRLTEAEFNEKKNAWLNGPMCRR